MDWISLWKKEKTCIPDISHYRPVSDWDALQKACPFLIFKGTQGTDFTEPTAAENIRQCEARRIPYWIYTYLNAGNEKEQAEYLLAQCPGGKYLRGYCLDVEEENAAEDVKEALQVILKAKGKAILYAGRSVYRREGFRSLIDRRGSRVAWWEARYGKNDGAVPDRSVYPIDDGVDLWQYTSCGSCPGIAKPCDLSLVVSGKTGAWYR